MNSVKPLLEIDQLCYRYPQGGVALNNISLTVQPHERVGLIGPNGAGKSTLLMHLNGSLRATSGTIRINGHAITPQTLPSIRAQVGLVFQNPDDQLFSPSVYDDVAFGPHYMACDPAEIKQRVTQALDQVGMADFAQTPPFHLSVGQKKRVALATVLSMSPSLFVLDEPSAGLDPRGRRALIELILTLSQGVIIASHDMRLVKALCERIVIIDGGQVAADGGADSLLNDQSLLEAHGLEMP